MLGFAAAVVGASFARAAGDEAPASGPVHPTLVQQCEGMAAPNDRAVACNILLQSGRLQPKEVALAHFFLGLARVDLHLIDEALAQFDAAVAADPSLWYADWVRADILDFRRDYKNSGAALTRVVDANPTMAAALARRAAVFSEDGRHDEAVADYTKAIAIARPLDRIAELYASRGLAYEASHKWDAAMADFAEAIKRDDQLGMAYFARGRVEFLTGQTDAAIADLAKAGDVKAAVRDPYCALWLFLAQRRRGIDGSEQLRRLTAAVDRNGWPWPLVQVFLGELPPDGIKMIARAYPWQVTRDICEREFYLAELALGKGDHDKARALFQAALDTRITEYIEYNAASFEIGKLAQ